MNKYFRIWILLLAGCLILFVTCPGHARYEYAVNTGKGCTFCHQESTGGPLKEAGFAYIRNGYQYPIPERILEKARILRKPAYQTLRFIIGYLHLLAAVIFFGAIFYIHIFIGPRQLHGGIPRGERFLGISCMAILTITGVFLTWMRMDRWAQFFNNTFGLMLFIKILLFLLMVAIGMTAVTLVHRRMKKEVESSISMQGAKQVTRSNLGNFDGSQGKPAYIAYENKAYDVSQSTKWKNGKHFAKHTAGTDLTGSLQGAPHGPEVLERVRQVGEISKGRMPIQPPCPAHRLFIKMAYVNLVLIFLILGCISVWRWDLPVRWVKAHQPEVPAGKGCIGCHKDKTPGIYHDWSGSVHSKVDVTCHDCHKTDPESPFFSSRHLQYDDTRVAMVVTPKTCAGCHPEEAGQYEKSKHAHTLEIIWKIDHWLKDGMNNAIERSTGCYACHGSVVELRDGRPLPGTWPNVGVGRKNPDDTLGSCSSCHTRHRFSVMEARKPEACDQCHLGPDHPQIEIYNESKHGTIYHAEGAEWNWSSEDGQWLAGRDYRAPTCSACHMSAAGDVRQTHDVTERLSWETQAPLTIRPKDFKPFPSGTNWEVGRRKMEKVCLQCHSLTWTRDHFSNLDEVVKNYNDIYYTPIWKVMDDLYASGLLSKERYFDDPLEWEFYELWHHEGRRARFGAAMMAPDYAWWHGFYEVKHRFNHIMEEAAILKRGGTSHTYESFPGKYSDR